MLTRFSTYVLALLLLTSASPGLSGVWGTCKGLAHSLNPFGAYQDSFYGRCAERFTPFKSHKIFEDVTYHELKTLRDLMLHPDKSVDVAAAFSSGGNKAFQELLTEIRDSGYINRWSIFLRSFLRWDPEPKGRRAQSNALMTALMHTGESVGAALGSGLWLLSPVPYHGALFQGKMRRIYGLIRKHRDATFDYVWGHALSQQQRDYVEARRMKRDLEVYHSYKRGQSRNLDRIREASATAYKIIPLIASFVLSASLFSNSVMMSPQQLEGYYTASDQTRVMLINDISLASHTAILIDGTVYSFGRRSLETYSLGDYLRLGGTTRSMTFTPIEMSDDEINQLKMLYGEDVMKRYCNVTLVNDCTTMTVVPLSQVTGLEVPVGINVSPSATEAWFSVHRLLGNPRVGDNIYVYATDSTKELALARTVRALTHSVEAKLLLLASPFLADEQESLRSLPDLVQETPENQKLIDARAAHYEEHFRGDLNFLTFDIQIESVRVTTPPEERSQLQEEIKTYLEDLRATVRKARDAAPDQRIEWTAQELAIQRIEEDFINRLGPAIQP